MKELNIDKIILQKRREKGLTQDDIANYIGVSKASVSKWETGQSYPDITILPQLATFFNISMDELMGYEPQMTKEQIRSLYQRLSSDFAVRPFEEVLEECHDIIKKYYSCFPLLFQIAALLVNNSTQSKNMTRTMEIIEESKQLFHRIRQESDDTELRRLALNMEAFCALTLGKPDEVIELLSGVSNKIISAEALLASAYQMQGKSTEAKTTLQIGIYQHMGSLFGALTDYLLLCTDSPEQFERTLQRALAIAETFDLKQLHPAILAKFYIIAAQGCVMIGNPQQALNILETYTTLVTGHIYPLILKGDDFFTLLDQWIDELDLGSTLPRDTQLVRQSMISGITDNPVFSTLAENHQFQHIIERLNDHLSGGIL